MLYIPVIKRLSLTKTLKLIDYNKDEQNNLNVNYEHFGDLINTNDDKINDDKINDDKINDDKITFELSPIIKKTTKMIIKPLENEIKTPTRLIIKPNNMTKYSQSQNLYIQEPSV